LKDDQYLTIQELAEWVQCSEWWLYNVGTKTLGIPHVRLGKSIRFRVGAVREWLSAQESRTAETA
jgi:excisionase family DNA binding protein